MSLINDMLKDLERRPQAKAIEHSEMLAGLKFTVSHEWRINKNYYVIIGSLFLVLLLASTYLFFGKHISLSAVIPATSQTNNSAITQTAAAQHGNDTLLKSQLQPAILTGIALQVQQNSTALRFLLNQNTFYRVSNDVKRNEFIIIFDKTHLLAALPKINYLGSGVENIRAYTDEKDNLKLVLQLADDVEIKRLDLNEEGKAPELQLDLIFKNSVPSPVVNNSQRTPTIPVIIKKPVAENNAEQQYQQALALCQDGQNQNAMHLLANVLLTFPQYNLAREKLASLYLDSGNLTAAKYLVTVGLNHEPDYLPFTELKAHVLMREGKLDAAINALEIAAPPLAKNPEYHAFIAALYQRAGKAKIAANLYKQLITLQPMNGKWWLGFGVALDSMGSHEQALEAYANANNAGGLSPELKAYVSTQLHNA